MFLIRIFRITDNNVSHIIPQLLGYAIFTCIIGVKSLLNQNVKSVSFERRTK